LFALLRSQGLHYGVGGESGGEVNEGHIAKTSADVPQVQAPLQTVHMQVEIAPDYFKTRNIFQGWMFIPEDLDANLMPLLRAQFPTFDYVRWHASAVDVLPKNVNKFTGCQWAMQDAGSSPAHAYAFGDAMNDLEMLRGVGTGIAMGNAHPTLKAVANRVTAAVHEDGVAKMVEQLLAEFSQAG
jgi:hydroxymethylpyrimidine pyrophosphatase-like HAD family hydrolase